MVPSGMMVLWKIAPVKSAPFVTEFRRLAPVRSVKRKPARVRSALVIEAPKKSPLVKVPLARLARPRLTNSKRAAEPIALVRIEFSKVALMKSEPVKLPLARLAPEKLACSKKLFVQMELVRLA